MRFPLTWPATFPSNSKHRPSAVNASQVLLIIPTFNHASTLGWAVASAQNQSHSDCRIVIIGDGVNDDTRDVVSPLLREDARLSFLDKPKSIRHGEEYRHEVIMTSSEPVIGYLGDDDLLFVDHLEVMLAALGSKDFANSLPVLIDPDSTLEISDTDLSKQESIDWHRGRYFHRNSVSLTGVVHTRESYERLPFGWRPAPKGRWSDHYMWEQYFSLEGFRGATATRSTTAKFASSQRGEVSAEGREKEIHDFWLAMQQPDFEQTWEQRVLEAHVDRYARYRSWRLTAPIRVWRARSESNRG